MLVIYNICLGWRKRWCQGEGILAVVGKLYGRGSCEQERWWKELITVVCAIGGGIWGVGGKMLMCALKCANKQ